MTGDLGTPFGRERLKPIEWRESFGTHEDGYVDDALVASVGWDALRRRGEHEDRPWIATVKWFGGTIHARAASNEEGKRRAEAIYQRRVLSLFNAAGVPQSPNAV